MYASYLHFIAICSLLISEVLSDVLDGVGNVFDVACGEACHGDSSVSSHVNVVLIDHCLTLLGGEACEREHADLVGDMVPVALGAVLNQCILQDHSHLVHSVSHCLQFKEPLLSVIWNSEYLGCDPGTMDGWA